MCNTDPPSRPYEDEENRSLEALKKAISGREFTRWRRIEEIRENIKDGNPEYNSGGFEVSDRRHSPHNLLQCPRKIWYREHNAPGETQSPAGIFELGTYMEEEEVEPFLDRLAREHGYFVTNSIWVEAEIETRSGPVRIKGSTDPVFVTEDGTPQLLTEVKTKQSLSRLSEPNRHHRAQATSYQAAIAETYDIDPPDCLIIYVGRKHLDVQRFELEFDSEFFAEVTKWMADLTECRIEDVLPPQDPEMDWECDLCPYRERCGQGDEPWEGMPAAGFLPRVEYPESQVRDHLVAHSDEKITPTIAYQYPALAEEFGVYNWVCPACGERFEWDQFDGWDGDSDEPPWCPSCASERDACVFLRGMLPVVDG